MQDIIMLGIAALFAVSSWLLIVLSDAYGRQAMNGSEIIGLVLSVGLLVYLTIALLKPEWFA